MMKKLLSTLLLMAGLVCLQQGMAQSKLSIDNIASIYLRDSGPIIAKEEVKGYFFLYQSDKIDKKTNEYTLQILDDNLNKVKSIQFNDSRYLSLLESSFNGSDIMFQFFDADRNLLDYRVYDISGEQKFSYTRAMDKKTEHYIRSNALLTGGEASQNKNLFGIENKGFITIIPLRVDDKTSFEVNFYQTSSKNQWSYQPDDGTYITGAGYLGSTDNVAIFAETKIQHSLSGKMQTFIMGLNLQTGEKLFEYPTNQDKYNFIPMNISTFPGSREFMLMGIYFSVHDLLYDKSLGLGAWVLNERGQKLISKYSAWDGEISDHLKTGRKGGFEDIGELFFHNILQTEDGKIFAIGEGYKQDKKGAVHVNDMVLLQFNKKFNVESVNVYSKDEIRFPKNSLQVFSGSYMAASFIKALNGFDYSFLQTDRNHSTFTFGYTDRVKSNDYKGRTFNTVTYSNNNITTDKINLKTNAGRLKVLPARLGSVLVMEYFKKEKRLDMRLEKVN